MKERLGRDRRRHLPDDLWAATYVLLGLRYTDQVARILFQQVLGMKESVTYQAIVAAGRAEEARRWLLMTGEKRLGPADPSAVAAINRVTDVEQLERLGRRLWEVDTWEQQFAAPQRRRRNGRRRPPP